jgi:hypothetical protein
VAVVIGSKNASSVSGIALRSSLVDGDGSVANAAFVRGILMGSFGAVNANGMVGLGSNN